MATISLTLADGGEFSYDDSLKEIYRIRHTNGLETLKIEGCPEILIKSKKQARKVKKAIIDSYLLNILSPSLFLSNSNKIIAALKRDYPYLDAHIEPVLKSDTKIPVNGFTNSDLLYDEEYDTQSFLLLLSGSRRDSEVKYYENNMIGHLDDTRLQSYINNLKRGDGFPLIYKVYEISKWRKPVVESVARRLGLRYVEY